MSDRQDGWPAFPLAVTTGSVSKGFKVNVDEGMTLRDYFAGQALAGISSLYTKASGSPEKIAIANSTLAYLMADAMLAERGVI